MYRSSMAAAAAFTLIVAGCSSNSGQTAPSHTPSPAVTAASPKPDALDGFPVQHMSLAETEGDYNVTLDDGSPIPALVLRRSIPRNGSPVKIDPNKSCTTAKGGKLICWQSAKIEHQAGFPTSVVVSLAHDGVECSFSATVNAGDRVLRSCSRASV